MNILDLLSSVAICIVFVLEVANAEGNIYYPRLSKGKGNKK